MTDLPTAFGALLERRGLSQAALADLLFCTPRAVALWLAGKRTPIPSCRRDLARLMREAGIEPPEKGAKMATNPTA